MVYDPKRELLFIHVPKNAGKSIEAAFDLVSSEDQENYRWRSNANRLATYAQRVTSDPSARRRLWGVIDQSLVAQHLTYAEITLLGLLGPTSLDRAVKFGVCRNPYDRTVSLYFHLQPAAPSVTGFRTWIANWLDSEPRYEEGDVLRTRARGGGVVNMHAQAAFRRPQWQYFVGLDGENHIDYTLRFEHLDRDAEALARAIGVTQFSLGWIGKQRADRTWEHFYDNQTRKRVSDAFERDFDFFHYAR